MNPRSLRENVLWALAGNAGYAACQWGVLVAIAKLGDATDVGRFALALAITTPAMMFANLHLRAVQATDAAEQYPFGAYFGLRLMTTAVALLAIGATLLGNGSPTERWAIVAVVGGAKAIESVCDVLYGHLQRAERQRRIALSLLLRGGLGVVAVAGTLAAGGSLLTALMWMTAAWAACLVTFDLPGVGAQTALKPVWQAAVLRPLAWTALPMGCVMALGSFTTNLPRYALEAAAGTQALGHFAAIVYLFVAAAQPMLALGAAVSPRLAQHFWTDLPAYQRLVRYTLQAAAALGLCVIAGALGVGERGLAWIYTPDYAVHARAFAWAAVATAIGFVASAFGYAATAARRFHAQLATSVIALITCATASTLLIPAYGLVGAAWAMGCTEIVRMLCGAGIYLDTIARRAPLGLPGLAAEVTHGA